jgi:hypothetical protein
MHLKPTAGCQISNVIFEKQFWRWVSINIKWKIYQGRQSSCPLGVSIKGITRVFNWRKCLGEIMHLKPTDSGNTFNVNPKLARSLPSLIYFSWDIYRDPLHNCFSNIKVDISHPAVGLRCIISPRHLRQLKTRVIPLMETVPRWDNAPQAHSRVWNINFDIWKTIVEEGGLYKYPMKNISRTANFLPTWGLS